MGQTASMTITQGKLMLGACAAVLGVTVNIGSIIGVYVAMDRRLTITEEAVKRIDSTATSRAETADKDRERIMAKLDSIIEKQTEIAKDVARLQARWAVRTDSTP